MWNPHSQRTPDGRGLRIAIDLDSSPLSYAEALQRWQQDADFRSFFVALLADSPFSAFRWETPPITTATANRQFEFVILDSPGLAKTPDVQAFAAHFVAASAAEVAEVPNLAQ